MTAFIYYFNCSYGGGKKQPVFLRFLTTGFLLIKVSHAVLAASCSRLFMHVD